MDNALICRKIVSPEKPKPDNSKDTNTYSKILLRKKQQSRSCFRNGFLMSGIFRIVAGNGVFCYSDKEGIGPWLVRYSGLGGVIHAGFLLRRNDKNHYGLLIVDCRLKIVSLSADSCAVAYRQVFKTPNPPIQKHLLSEGIGGRLP